MKRISDIILHMPRLVVDYEATALFIEKLPDIEKLMPKLSFAEIAGDAEPPVAEQLISSNALRQRRYRERHALRRNEPEALQAPKRNADSDGDGDGDGNDDHGREVE